MAYSKIGSILSLAAATSLILFLGKGSPTLSSHLETDDFLILEREVSASTQSLEPHYQTSGLFLSEIYETDHSFELLGLNWQQKLPEGTLADIEIRFRSTDGDWSEWQHIHEDEDHPSHEQDEKMWTYVITQKSNAFQYRANLSTKDTALTPKLSDISFDYVEGGERSVASKLEKMVFDADQDIVSRKEWGANEELRVAKKTNDDFESELDEKDEEKYPDMKIVETIETNEDGDPLLWPLEYPKDVKKIIIHHTASSSDLDDPEAAIRAIYYYHAVTRGWGDIGYNYIVAPDGTVYEGRAGGDGVVAGHAEGYNTGSVGIALLGNYEESKVSGKMMKALQGLVFEKATLHGIDADGTSSFRGEVIPNILGHRDVGSTACPGVHTYDYLEDIREMVALSMDAASSSSKNKDYAYKEATDRELVILEPNGSETISVKISNTGTKTWDKNTFLTVNANSAADSLINIPKDGQKRTALMKESSVKPGKTATFTFTANAKFSGGLASFDMVPVFNGNQKSTQMMELAFFVDEPSLDFTVQSSTAPKSLNQGASASVTVVLKNTGNLTWTNSGDYAVSLVKNGSSNLSSSSTLATLKETEVKPGKTGTFTFTIKAPSKEGSHTLAFSPSMKNSTASAESTGQIKVTVSKSTDSAAITATSTDLTFEPGETKTLWVQVKNSSGKTWSSTGSSAFSYTLSTLKGFSITKEAISFTTLKDKYSTKLYFKVTASKTPGTYTLSLTPKLGSRNLLKTAYSLILTVEDAAEVSESSYDDPIRVKLTPDNDFGSPVLSADSAFSLYSGTTLLKTFNADSRVKVTDNGEDSFKVTSGSSKWTVNDEALRFVPEEDGIMEIVTMQQVPAWNTSLNDNLFRGTIEIREVDGEPIFINELPLEDYLKGIGEVSNGDNEDKVKTILILARTYAYYYMTEDEKFPGKPYHLDDDPDSSQKYLGYGFESRSENVANAVEETEGLVVTYKDQVVKTPYFSQSDGKATKSAKSVWGWTDTPWLVSVSDKYCTDTDGTFEGHGVGLSGCGATAMAEAGKSFEEIIKYYYTGVELSSITDL